MYVCMYVCTVYVCMYPYVWYVCMYYVCMYYVLCTMYVWMFGCLDVCMRLCVYVYVCTPYICTLYNVCMYVRMYVYICMYAWLFLVYGENITDKNTKKKKTPAEERRGGAGQMSFLFGNKTSICKRGWEMGKVFFFKKKKNILKGFFVFKTKSNAGFSRSLV